MTAVAQYLPMLMSDLSHQCETGGLHARFPARSRLCRMDSRKYKVQTVTEEGSHLNTPSSTKLLLPVIFYNKKFDSPVSKCHKNSPNRFPARGLPDKKCMTGSPPGLHLCSIKSTQANTTYYEILFHVLKDELTNAALLFIKPRSSRRIYT